MKHIKSFDDFLKSKNRPNSNNVDWAGRKDYWLGSIDKLYSTIRQRWLNDYIRQKQIVFSVEEITLQEDFFGAYSTKKAIIRIGGDMLILKPVGGIVSGGYGRIDIRGRSGAVNLILNNSGQWEYRVNAPFLEYAVLDKQAFLEFIEQLMQ